MITNFFAIKTVASHFCDLQQNRAANSRLERLCKHESPTSSHWKTEKWNYLIYLQHNDLWTPLKNIWKRYETHPFLPGFLDGPIRPAKLCRCWVQRLISLLGLWMTGVSVQLVLLRDVLKIHFYMSLGCFSGFFPVVWLSFWRPFFLTVVTFYPCGLTSPSI